MLAVVFGDVAAARRTSPGCGGRFSQLAATRCGRAGARGRWRASTTRKRSAGRSAATSATASTPWQREPERLRVLFVSPYPICPPVHGGGVFMYQTLRRARAAGRVHVVELLDWEWQDTGQSRAARVLRVGGVARAAVERCPADDVAAAARGRGVRQSTISSGLIHRQIYSKKIDVLQLEYTPLAQYRGEYRRIAQRPVRARRLLPVDRPRRWGTRSGRSKESRRGSSICGRCGTSCARCRSSTRCRCARRPIATTC